jgi:hypothetical protein
LSDDSEDDRHSDDIGLNGSEDYEDAVEEILDIDSIYNVDTGDHGVPQKISIQKHEKAQRDECFSRQDLSWRTSSKVARDRREKHNSASFRV